MIDRLIFWKQDLFPLDVAEKFGNRPVEDSQRRSHHFDEEDDLGPWWNNAHFPGGRPSSDESFAIASSPGTTSTGANWTDSDGNGYYNLGDTLVVTGSVFVGTSSGGVGSGGGGSLPPDDTTSRGRPARRFPKFPARSRCPRPVSQRHSQPRAST